ncbi:TetR/AcrR family transcriptional regulator [Algicola sagamiensis]|uniref:TetR/AcrR family transcriptional regulator n=1 Tax=Algicola sagamiensis TaxID=163869 RepID=UPI0003630313|nr:TetR/AcrR family transcriptional regulator [Algicola sagamiensis]
MRSAEFDRDQVLRSAMDAFIANGYNKTSMQDLKKATGLHPGSIYCAFQSKRGLLLAALEHYRDEKNAEFHALFEQHATVMDGVAAYLAHVVEECVQEEIQDCLLQKSLSELSRQDEEVEAVISQMLNQWQDGFTQLFEKAQVNQEISKEKTAQELSQFLVMGIYGIRTYSYTKPEPGVLQQLAKAMIQSIQN